MTNNQYLVLGTLHGIEMTVASTLALLERMDTDTVIGEVDGETITVGDFTRRLRRLSAMPEPVPTDQRLPDAEWAEAVILRGEAPYGRCPWCNTAKGVAGCLNLCDLPAAAAHEFNTGLQAVIAENRARINWLETLGGCTCGPANLSGYEIERPSHGHRCPMYRAPDPAAAQA